MKLGLSSLVAAEEEAELEDDRGEAGEEAGDGHDQHVAVLHVRELVRHHALELGGESVRMMPVVAQTVALFWLRPIAKAFGTSVSATAMRGFGRSAWMQSLSIIA